ncbi:MAG TPA: hypothetical protein VIM73_19350 [Polyangiaceae bacterium]
MGKKKKAEHRALRAAIRSWLWRDEEANGTYRDVPPPSVSKAPPSSARTELSATVFSGDAADWVSYLQTPPEERYERSVAVRVHVHRDPQLLAFEPESDASAWLARLLDSGFRLASKQLEHKPHALKALRELVFDNVDNDAALLRVRLSPLLPSDGTREVAQDQPREQAEVRLVFNSGLARDVYTRMAETGTSLPDPARLGLVWPLLSRSIATLAYPSRPRDLFVDKIRVQAKLAYVAINLLYEGKKSGLLIASAAGNEYRNWMAAVSGIPADRLESSHPYFRMLAKLSFMSRAQPYKSYSEEACVVAREYLDTTYLRLSLAGAMPEIPSAMQAMPFERGGSKPRTPGPEIGKYGILDEEDLSAWKTVSGPLRDRGFTPIRQLGIGEFGRVYEVLNGHNAELPDRLALKVDRIVGKKKKAILEAEEAMHVGRELARSPHVIRLYDTGTLAGKRFTYHVLQLIDGDTLDNLVGVTGTEHASVSRPPTARRSELEARQEFERAINSRGSELWRRRRIASPFTHVLSPGMVMDLLTSVLLWLEEVHELGYAINDLKNGNLMMSRRGQLKGIDLDSYAPVHSPKDKMTDFMFLAVSLILLLFSGPVTHLGRNVPWEELIESEARLRQGLASAWPFGNVELLSDGRVSRAEMMDLIVDLVQRSRHLVYTKHPELYSADVVRLVDVKRRLLVEDLVVD